ncbi:PQQ-binding-like beta-propeller repeat protein [Cryptosporangium japonicum]|uniref:PQQ-binding-like beta-propeller repeat protein n=1 Tax=Cryptosporangium japonicum TaxID=80872 RepID=A0ABP3DV05_9ACTN
MLRSYAAIGAVSLLVLAGCSNDKDAEPEKSPSPSAPKSAAPSPTQRPAFDPPTRFGTQGAALPPEASENKISVGGTNVEPLPVTLHKTTAYIASTASLLAVDTATGRTLATITPSAGSPGATPASPWVGTNPAEAPVLWSDNGRATILSTFVVDKPATGTQKAGRAVEVVAVDAETTKSLWTAQVDVPAGLDQGVAGLAANPVGVDGTTLAVAVSYQSDEGVVAVDLAAKKALWSRTGFRPDVVGTGVVAGSDASSVSALNLADGKQKWTVPQLTAVSPLGPGLLIASGTGQVAFLDAATGKARDRSTADYTGVRCRFDGKDVTVCARTGWAAGLDATSGKTLWELPDQANTRVAPLVTAVWHGAVYGSTDNGPVVLDARSGQDREVSPGLAPMVVNEYVGIGQPPTGGSGVRSYPAAK